MAKVEIIENDDIEFIRDVRNIAVYLNWRNELGNRLAQEIIDKIHAGTYGSKSGIWPQFDKLIERLESMRKMSVFIEIDGHLINVDTITRITRSWNDKGRYLIYFSGSGIVRVSATAEDIRKALRDAAVLKFPFDKNSPESDVKF